jgi:hypothetical protein
MSKYSKLPLFSVINVSDFLIKIGIEQEEIRKGEIS